jgi:hypothetical protein
LLAATNAPGAELKVTSDFENGSARVIAIDQTNQTLRFQPAGDPQRGFPCWWYFRVDGVNTNLPLTFELSPVTPILPYDGKRFSRAWAMPDRAALSVNGTNWTQTPPGENRGGLKIYRINTTSPTLWLAWGPPFTVTDAKALVQHVSAAHSFASAFELCRSREGHSVPGLQIAEGDKPAGNRPGVWIIARQHAWEVGGSWVARGIIEWLSGPDDGAQWIRRNAEVFVVPIMDADRVATGDGGKASLPQDHNRDWSATPHWPEVAAVQKRILPLLKQNRMDLLLDLHNPGASDKREEIYVTTRALVTPVIADWQDRFVASMREEFPDLFYVDDKPSPDHPETWRTLTTTWLSDRANTNTIGFAIETPWNTQRGTAEGYLEAGQKLGRVMEKYLRERAKRP